MKRSRSAVRPGGGEGQAIPDLTISPIVRSHRGHLGLRRWAGTGGAVVLAVAAVAALSSSAGAASTPPNPGGSASGSVASITGTSMEVQSASAGQTTVNTTPSTTFSQTLTVTQSAIVVGGCLTVTGTPAKSSKTTITARSVSISQPSSSGTCASGAGSGFGRGGFPGRGAQGGGGFPGGGCWVDSRAEAGANGRGPFAGGTFAFAKGKVTAVTGSSVTMSGTLRSGFGQAPKSKNTKKPSTPKTQQLTVTLSKSTTLSETQSTSFSALAVGDCVNAFGQAGRDPSGDRGDGQHRRPVAAIPVRPNFAREDSAAPSPSEPGWRRHARRPVVIGGIVAVVLVIGGATAWATGSSASSGYRMTTVVHTTVATSLDVVGTVEPVNDASASFQVAGKVATVSAAVGDAVTAGQTLATLDPTALSESVSSAESSLSSDQAKLTADENGQTSSSASTSSTPSSSTPSTSRSASTNAALTSYTVQSGSSVSSGGIAQDQATLVTDQHQESMDQQQEAADLAQAQSICGTSGTPTTTHDA